MLECSWNEDHFLSVRMIKLDDLFEAFKPLNFLTSPLLFSHIYYSYLTNAFSVLEFLLTKIVQSCVYSLRALF